MQLPAFLRKLQHRLSLTREGLVWLLLCLGMLATGLVKGINLVTLLGCIMLAAGLCNFLQARRQLGGVRVRRELPDFLVAGEPAPWRLRVESVDRRTRLGLQVADPVPGANLVWFLDRVPAEGLTLERTFAPERRGIFPLPAPAVTSGYPLGLAALRRRFAEGERLHVAPRIGTVYRSVLRHWLARHCPTVGVVRSYPIRHPTGQTEFHGLRTYRPGDNPRWIHWRSSARRGTLLVREFEEYPNDDLVLIVDPTAAGGPAFERLASVAASVCYEWCRQKGDRLTLLIAGPRPVCLEGPSGPALLTDTLRALAGLEPVLPGTLEPVLTVLRERPQPPTAHLLLTAGPSALPAAMVEDLQQPVAAVDVAAGEEAAFFDPAPPASSR